MRCIDCNVSLDRVAVVDLQHPRCRECQRIAVSDETVYKLARRVNELEKRVKALEEKEKR